MAADPFDRLVAADPIDGVDALPLPELDELERGWGADAAGRAPRRRRRLWHGGGGIASFALAGLVAAGAASATLTAVTGDPLGRVESVAVEPAGGTERLAQVTAMDPDGGPPWTVRIGRADPGLVCLNVGQREGGKLGIVGLDGKFRTSAVGGADQCAVAPTGDDILANARTFVGRTGAGNTSVVYGLAGPDARRIAVTYPDGAQQVLRLDPGGAFVVARRGSLTRNSPTLQFQDTDANGRYVRRIELGDPQAAARRIGARPAPTPYPLDPTKAVR